MGWGDRVTDSAFDKRADAHLRGSSLRNDAANYLEAIYGNARIEIVIESKKVDVVCKFFEHGKPTDLLVEVKDIAGSLHRTRPSKSMPIICHCSARSGRVNCSL